MKLAGCDALYRSVGMTVDVEGAHAADALTAVAVENNGLLALVDELLVEHVEHFKEARSGGNVLDAIVDESTLFLGTALTPYLEVYINIVFHLDCLL